MNIPYVIKKCSKCGRWLVANNVNFAKDKRIKNGLRACCKECKNKHSREYYEQNRDKVLERQKEFDKKYYERNKDKILSRQKTYREQNKDKIAKKNKEYREQNKDKIAARRKEWYEQNRERELEHKKKYYQSPKGQISRFNKGVKRRAKERELGNGITAEQWIECMSFFGWECAYSGKYLGGKQNQSVRSLDHIIPLNKGGANEIWNVVPMFRSFNSSKGDKNIEEWYRNQDYFNEERLTKIREWQEYAYNKYNKEEY